MNTNISKLRDLRWWFFKRKQAESDKLPSTSGALLEALHRSHYQLLVWNQDNVANPRLPSPEDYGRTFGNKQWEPIMTKELPAPHAVLHLVQCGCTKSGCSTRRCACRNSDLRCTGLCSCSDGEVECENAESSIVANESDDENEDII